ncbi:MAG: vacuolar iron transporter family protein [Frankiaceae bacterium]|jgi:VIT1/CCC1 family predicted Fe2+/Mn2+ transporter|nr:vacuolar iron transporter family protein [Frankiaceae bacterium]MDX6225068.1 vacuolar iron transporter family protein [Frankiales bacterium]MDX6275247.1 vacuolar iron transporter family protein [Frankiales bacterium]
MSAETEATDGRPEIHHDHRDVTGGWLRPAVFGMNDGLVSNFALIAGLSGGGATSHTVALAGLAGVFAGAFSMGSGEYISVASQSELAQAEIDIEKHEIRHRPEAELRELAMLYEGRGVDPETARSVAKQLSADPEQAWRIHAREELGIDPDDLPSPWIAASSSFVAFSLGAVVPLLPYLFGGVRLLVPLVLSLMTLFVTGALVSRFTNRPWWYSGLRQVVLGGLAAAVTYAVGGAVGTTVG